MLRIPHVISAIAQNQLDSRITERAGVHARKEARCVDDFRGDLDHVELFDGILERRGGGHAASKADDGDGFRILTQKQGKMGEHLLSGHVAGIGGIENDTTSMIDSIKAAGTPNATNGSAISSQLVDDLTKFRDSIDKIHTQAGSISTASPQAFQADAQNLLKGFQSTSNLISSFGSDPFAKSAQLEQAFNRDPACEKMR